MAFEQRKIMLANIAKFCLSIGLAIQLTYIHFSAKFLACL